jgi:hypothetical protein
LSRTDTLASTAFLLDPDPVLRLRAVTLLEAGAGEAPRVPPEDAGRIRSLLLAAGGAATSSGAAAGGDGELSRRIRGLISALPHEPGTDGTAAPRPTGTAESELAEVEAAVPWPEEAWSLASRRVHDRVKDSDAANQLRSWLAAVERDGLDVVLALDATKSMESSLGEVQDVARRLLLGLCWGVSGLRIGLLVYRDEIEEQSDLTAQPEEDLLPTLRQVQAVGGGDVAEGVHAALRGALELKRFSWRSDAMKHVFLVGDAPPPFAELRGLTSLAAACFHEGGYRVHTLGFDPPEDAALPAAEEGVPFFRRIAHAGGGRNARIHGHNLAPEILLCILGEQRSALVDRCLPLIEDASQLRSTGR